MVYPYATLGDTTEVVHSEMGSDGRIKVYIEKAVYEGFHNATFCERIGKKRLY